MNNYTKILLGSLALSSISAIVGDFVFTTKLNAENYLLGIFFTNLSTLMFTVFTIATIIGLGYWLLIKLLFKTVLSFPITNSSERTYNPNCNCEFCMDVRSKQPKKTLTKSNGGNKNGKR
jgi:hypothetical protein